MEAFRETRRSGIIEWAAQRATQRSGATLEIGITSSVFSLTVYVCIRPARYALLVRPKRITGHTKNFSYPPACRQPNMTAILSSDEASPPCDLLTSRAAQSSYILHTWRHSHQSMQVRINHSRTTARGQAADPEEESTAGSRTPGPTSAGLPGRRCDSRSCGRSARRCPDTSAGRDRACAPVP
jgi:hypothetical protein